MFVTASHLLHPWRAAKLARTRFLKRVKMARFAAWGDRRFAADSRYNLQSVSHGFAARPANPAPNEDAILERICAAWSAATRHHPSTPAYQPTAWWERVRERNLQPVTRALTICDVPALRRMYSNFFRDPCSIGLIGASLGMPKPAAATRPVHDLHRRVYLADTLYRLDYWADRTTHRFKLSDLAGPSLGNPYGVLIDGTLIEDGAEFRHYCAQTISALLGNAGLPQGSLTAATVAEIGGGFGGMAFYLLRDRPGVKYLDFDVPESLALTAYFLIRAFPHLTFRLCGEAPAPADVVLLPLAELANLAPNSADLVFSSRAMSDVSPAAMDRYLHDIVRINPVHFLCIGSERSRPLIAGLVNTTHVRLQLLDARPSDWHKQTNPEVSEVESLYRIA